MIGVLFEVWLPNPGAKAQYLDIARALTAELQNEDGFVSIERFQSLADANKLLSLSFWRDESAVERWRKNEAHRGAQRVGRETIFDDYRLRVVGVMRDYGKDDRAGAPADSRLRHG